MAAWPDPLVLALAAALMALAVWYFWHVGAALLDGARRLAAWLDGRSARTVDMTGLAQKILPLTTTRPADPAYPAVSLAIQQATDSVIAGDKTPQEAANAAAAARKAGRDTVLLFVQRGNTPGRFVGVKVQ